MRNTADTTYCSIGKSTLKTLISDHITTLALLRLVNQSGVGNYSTIEIDYDPTYENVTLHKVGVIRDGSYIDKLPGIKLESFRTERDIERLLYNGTKTLTAILEDVRVGDVLQYSFTAHGINPSYKDIIEYRQRTQYSTSVADMRFRLLVDAATPLTIRKQDVSESEGLVTKTVANGVAEYTWQSSQTHSTDWYDDEPIWEKHFPVLAFSSVNSWEDIVQWATPKYQFASEAPQELEAVAQRIRKRHSEKAERIGAAVRWVQDEIRYFGVELGDNSHNPSPPSETLSRRFGDCKDKTVLLLSLLKALDPAIEAHPALVDSSGSLRADDVTARLHAFNHVIVRIVIDGKNHWVDPTLNNQQGPLGSFYEPNFGKALVLAPGQTDLTEMSDGANVMELVMDKVITLDSDTLGRADLTVSTRRKGYAAEDFRAYVSRVGTESVTDEYLDFYRSEYEYVESASAMRMSEYPRNTNLSFEHYTLEDLWWEDEDGEFEYVVSSEETRGYLLAPESPNYRKRSYQIQHPVSVAQTNVIIYPGGVNGDGSVEEVVSNDYFTYTTTITQDKSTGRVNITHRYESHARSVPAEQMRSYAKDVDRAVELSGIAITPTGIRFFRPKEDVRPTTQGLRNARKVARN